MLISLSFILVVIITGYVFLKQKRSKNYPPGPKRLPYFGNSLQLKKKVKELGDQSSVFNEWCEKYKTNVLGLRLGQENYIVANDYEMIKTVHSREEFDGRPDTFFLRLRTMGTRLGITCVDGPLWLEQRTFTVRHLREAGFGRKPMETQIQKELIELLEEINKVENQPQWPGELLPSSVINVLWTFAAGTRISRHDKRLLKLISLLNLRSKAFDIAGGILNQLPFIRFIAPEWSGFNLINRFNRELNDLFMETIKEHYANFSKDKISDDLIYAYIHEILQHKNVTNSNFNDTQLSMIMLDVFIAGSQTTSTTLDLAFMMMVVRPDIQLKVQKEIDSVFRKTLPKYEFHKQLPYIPYTDAVLMEVHRFFHIVPISGPRRVLANTKLGEYNIPKNTIVLMHLKNIHKDKDYWGDPENFRPERFLNEQNEICNTERLVPFGQGRRKCLGDSLAKPCLFTLFVGVLQKFTISINTGDLLPSTKLLPGITLSPKPYNVLFRKR